MAQQTINIGASPNDGTGTPLRTAFQYTNSNFSELYTAVGPSGNNIVVPGNATITGDLTVDTSTLKVDSANNWVGVGTATPAVRLHSNVADAAEAARFSASTAILRVHPYVDATDKTRIQAVNGTITGLSDLTVEGLNLRFNTNAGLAYAISNTGVATWSNVGGVAGTAMTLNSTGLGVGGSVTNKLTVTVTPPTSNSDGLVINGPSSRQIIAGITGATYSYAGVGANQNLIYGGNAQLNILGDNQNVRIATSAGSYLLLDTSGNVGIGVTPSAWNSNYNALDIGQNGTISGRVGTSNTVDIVSNGFRNSAGNWVYKLATSNAACRYQLDGSTGGHVWYSGAAGTAGNTIAGFSTPAMTLDASGNLLVGTTGQNGSWNTKLTLSNDSGTTKWAVGPYLGGVTNFLISAGASAGVYLNGTAATSWTSASDERLKDIIEPISNAIAKVGSLRAVIGKFKFDENNTRKPFLIAQDIQAVLPEAVDSSNPDRLGVSYTEVIPLLVAAIKELTAEVNALKNA